MTRQWLSCLLVLLAILSVLDISEARETLEQRALGYSPTGTEQDFCTSEAGFSVYLIDNFDQQMTLVPELRTSHGEVVRAMLTSGRSDIHIRSFNTSLAKGLAKAVLDLASGVCIDAVVSAIPGSNYSYNQVSTLLSGTVQLSPQNIVEYKYAVRNQLLNIATHGFPSVSWLNRLDANPAKLREDAYKVAIIEKLSGMGVDVFLPYGNRDGSHRGKPLLINMLAFAEGIHIFSGRDDIATQQDDFPTSPLSHGEEKAIFSLMECPDREDGLVAHLDINEDGIADFSYTRGDIISFIDPGNEHSFAPPPLVVEEFNRMLIDQEWGYTILGRSSGVVVSREQYESLRASEFYPLPEIEEDKSLVWLNSPQHGPAFSFNPQCRKRGQISGSSFIPPLKVKEVLVGS